MRRTSIAAGLVWLISFGLWCIPAHCQELPAAKPAVSELLKREVSREGIAYLEKLRKRTPFGTNDLNLAALRAGMGSRRMPTIKDVKLIKVKVEEIPCEWVLAPGADPEVRLLYLHGGGFVSGSGGFYLAQAAHISAAAKCAVLLPDYRLAPEHPFPAGLDDCVCAHHWMVANGPGGPGPARATFVAGDSAGGSLTLATLLALRDRKLKLPAGGIPLSPTTDLTLASESLRTVSDPIISAKTMPLFRDHYLGKTDPKNPLASPVFGDYRGLPPLLIQVGEHEMLRDDSIRVARKARADGISVTLEVWPGMFHVFQSHEPLLPEAREAIAHMAEFMRSLLLVQGTPGKVPANRADDARELKTIAAAKDSSRTSSFGPFLLTRTGLVLRSAEELVALTSKAKTAKDPAVQKEMEAELVKLLKVDKIDWSKQIVLAVIGEGFDSLKTDGKVLTASFVPFNEPLTRLIPPTPKVLVLAERFEGEVKFVPKKK